jgi:chorismate mutase
MSEREISKLRLEIDAVDAELLAQLNRRAALVRKVGTLKGGAPAYRPERESDIRRRVAAQSASAGNRDGRLPERGRRIPRIISACRARAGHPRLLPRSAGHVQRAGGAPAFRAARGGRPGGDHRRGLPQRRVRATHFAVAPAENSTDGAVGRTLDLRSRRRSGSAAKWT